MKLKTYQGPTMPAVLAQVKRDLGTGAVIVQTRSFRKGGFFGLGAKPVIEITAGPRASIRVPNPLQGLAEQRQQMLQNRYSVSADRLAPKPATPAADSLLTDHNEQMKKEISGIRKLIESLVEEQRHLHEPQMPEKLFEFYLELIQREVAEEIARDLVTQIQKEVTGDQLCCAEIVGRRLVDQIDKIITTAGPINPNLNGSARVVALIGPTGVGKTTTIAKIAANLKLKQNKKVGFITIDTYRIGAVDQLRMYAQIIDIPLHVVITPAELKEKIQQMRDFDVILIDTAGRCQNDEMKLKELKTFMQAAQPDEIHLVLSGTTHHSHMLSAAEKFKPIGVDRIILTKLDEAISFGVILSVLQKVDASISYITTGQCVPDDIEVGNGRRLAQRLLGIVDAQTGLNREYSISTQ